MIAAVCLLSTVCSVWWSCLQVCVCVCGGVCRYHGCLWNPGKLRYLSLSSTLFETEFPIVWPCVYQAVFMAWKTLGTLCLHLPSHQRDTWKLSGFTWVLGIPTQVLTHVWLVLRQASISLALNYTVSSTPVQFSGGKYIPSDPPSPPPYAARTPSFQTRTPNQQNQRGMIVLYPDSLYFTWGPHSSVSLCV